MCFNSASSITNYVYVSLLAFIMYLYGDKYDKHISLFTLVVIQMQLAEYFMWKDQKCEIINKLATIAARFILFLQPLSIIGFHYLFDTMNISNNAVFIISIIYIITFFKSFYNYLSNRKTICSPDKNGHLQWNFAKNYNDNDDLNRVFVYTHRFIYFLIFIGSWFLFKNFQLGVFVSFIILISLLFHYIKFPKYNQWTTLWCFNISIGFTGYIIIRYFDHKYKLFN